MLTTRSLVVAAAAGFTVAVGTDAQNDQAGAVYIYWRARQPKGVPVPWALTQKLLGARWVLRCLSYSVCVSVCAVAVLYLCHSAYLGCLSRSGPGISANFGNALAFSNAGYLLSLPRHPYSHDYHHIVVSGRSMVFSIDSR